MVMWDVGLCLTPAGMGKHGSTHGADMLWLLTSSDHCEGLVLRARSDQDLCVLWNHSTLGLDCKHLPAVISLNHACPLTSELASNLNHPFLSAPVMLQEKYLVQLLQIVQLPLLVPC